MDLTYIKINSKIKLTQNKIWLLLFDIIHNRVYFKNHWINEIQKDYKICKKTLKKYLKEYFYKKKWTIEKRILIIDEIDISFYKDLQKIINKYKNIINSHTIEKWKLYLNNLR